MEKHAHCGYCGQAFASGASWPRDCGSCKNISYRNPLPVAVLVFPVDEGVLVIRRTIEPRKGHLALPGGFIDHGESWRDGCARELLEETGFTVDPKAIELFDVHSALDGTLLVFGLAPRVAGASLPPFTETNETSECLVLPKFQELAFPTHTQVLRDYFVRRQGSGSPSPSPNVA